MSRHVGVGTLTGRSAGRARGYGKTGWCKGLLFKSENPDPDPWTMNYPHIPRPKRGILVFQRWTLPGTNRALYLGVHINAAKPWRGKTKHYCECNHLLHYLKLLWIFMKVTVDTRTQKTMFGEWQNTLGYTKPFELTLTNPPADGSYRFCCMLNPPCWVSIRYPEQAPWIPLAE